MAKRKHTAARSRIYDTGERAGFARRSNLPPPSARGTSSTTWLVVGGIGVIALVAVLAYAAGWIGKPAATPGPSPVVACAQPQPGRPSGPPDATPLASPPAQPLGDGTTATIHTDLGDIVFKLYCGSAPVASQNFINLAAGSFYNGVGFHRVVPGFMIQGGDPLGTGGGGPGYSIPDEPVVGSFTRGVVAMARTSAPDSEGSQFFIMVADNANLDGGGYTIFGNVTSGMDVVDQIVSQPTDNSEGVGGKALNPVIMRSVTIQQP